MHFSKTYTQLLLSLPPELRDNAIQYRQLKKLINQIVRELSSLGLSPAVLQELLERSKQESDELSTEGADDGANSDVKGKGKARAKEETDQNDELPSTLPASSYPMFGQRHHNLPKVVYEFTDDSGRIEPHLRLWVDRVPPQPQPTAADSSSSGSGSSPRTLDDAVSRTEPFTGAEQDAFLEGSLQRGRISLLWALQKQAQQAGVPTNVEGESVDKSGRARIVEVDESYGDSPDASNPELVPSSNDHEHDHQPAAATNAGSTNEVVIPLAADMLFFQTLSTAMNDLSAHLATVQSDFTDTLGGLTRMIAGSARPTSTSSSSSFHPHSILTSKPWSVDNTTKNNSDLYSWREIFQLYIEAEVFESVHELDRGERSVEESEHRLKLFAERVATRGLGDRRKLKSKASREALETFLELNLFILNIKKFQFANAEATRKILKKHAKRTSLPYLGSELDSSSGSGSTQSLVLPSSNLNATTATTNPFQLPRVLVQAIGETLLPIIPHLDDYTCAICTSIAFKPIRLSCGHLFCVRCLVKMQKRGQGDCPMCRAPCVLVADRSNVDWALLNFMQDWFPIEAKQKLKQNQKEAAREELEELGVDPDQQCMIM